MAPRNWGSKSHWLTCCTYRKDEPAIIRSKLINDSVWSMDKFSTKIKRTKTFERLCLLYSATYENNIITKYNISVKVIYCAKYQWQPRWPKLKKSTLFECQCILHGSTNWEHHLKRASPFYDGQSSHKRHVNSLEWFYTQIQMLWWHQMKMYKMMQNNIIWKPFPAATGKL